MAPFIESGNKPASSSVITHSQSRIEVPYIKVTIGDFTFGVFQKSSVLKTEAGFYRDVGVTYPNFIQSLSITKINGQVNKYSLNILYPIRPGDDPNFFEKVFASVTKTRSIVFSYGDMNNPGYIYDNEEALIVDINPSFNTKSSTISYQVSAVSKAALGLSGSYNFTERFEKPSKIITDELLYSPEFNLTSLFPGMANEQIVEAKGLIAHSDAAVAIEAKNNITILDYIKYLVSLMHDAGEAYGKDDTYNSYYQLTIHDNINSDPDEEIPGPYFKISQVSKNKEMPDAYEINIGWPDNTMVMDFNLHTNQSYGIFYDWQGDLTANDYVKRLDTNGDWIDVYCPSVSSKNSGFETRPEDQVWWSKVTKFPISGSITIRGLLRPAKLMSYIRLNVIYYGWKHISSGLYIITGQQDQIDSNGYRSTLTLLKVGGDDSDDAYMINTNKIK